MNLLNTQIKRKGSVLVASMIILAAILLIGLSLASTSLRDRQASMGSAKSNQAFYGADAGLEIVMAAIKGGVIAGDITEVSQVAQEIGGDCNSDKIIAGSNFTVELKDKDGGKIDCNSSESISELASIKIVAWDSASGAKRAIEAPITALSAYLKAVPASGLASPFEVNLSVVVSGLNGGTFSDPDCDGGDLSNENMTNGTFTCSYDTIGTYNPEITITTQEGGVETFSTTVEAQAPYLNISLSPETFSGQAPQTVNFSTTTFENMPGDPIYSGQDCGGGGATLSGTSSSSGSFTCTYSSANTYTAGINASLGGKSASDNATVIITPPPTLTADLSASPDNGVTTLVTNLTTAVTIGGILEGTTTYSNQSCGGGTRSNVNGGSFTCTYPTAGTYTANITVSRGGLTDSNNTKTISVFVPATLTATLTATPYYGSRPLTSNLTTTVGGTAVGTITYSAHSCGGGTISGESSSSGSFTCTFATGGSYTASITVNRGGKTVSATTKICVASCSSESNMDGDGLNDCNDTCSYSNSPCKAFLCNTIYPIEPSNNLCDVDGSGSVNFVDVSTVRNAIGKCTCESSVPFVDGWSNVQQNGIIDAADYKNWLNSCYIQQ